MGRIFSHESLLEADAECFRQLLTIAIIRIVAGSDMPLFYKQLLLSAKP